MSASQFNEFPAGCFLRQAGSPLEKIHCVPAFIRGVVVPQSAVRVYTKAGLVVITPRAPAGFFWFAGKPKMPPKGMDVQACF
jgi:hypothetical protein